MAKYDKQFKLNVIRQYLSGLQSYREVARTNGIDYSMLRRWVESYQLHGYASLEPQYRRYSAQFKLEVLQRIRREGLSDRQAVTIYNLRNAGAINQWRSLYDAGGMGALAPKHRVRARMPDKPSPELSPRDMTEKQLREEVAYLRAELDYLKKLDALIQTERAQTLAKKRRSSRD